MAFPEQTEPAEAFNASEDGTGRGTPLVPVHAFDARQSDVIQYGDRSGPLDTDGHTIGVLSFSAKDHGADAAEELAPTLRAGGHANSHANAGVMPAVAVALRGREGGAIAELGEDVGNALRASSGGGDKAHVLAAMQVRRLTPRECERLQGFPDDYTRIPWSGWRPMGEDETPEECRAKGLEVRQSKKTGKWRVKDVDGPRYKALGNSWAVPVARWIGARIDQEISR